MPSPDVSQRSEIHLRHTSTAASHESRSLYETRAIVKSGSQILWFQYNSATIRQDPGEQIEADFEIPRSKEFMANEQRQFVMASQKPYYDIDLPELE
jgi:hypothetical protein